jgi:signal transduction histidine kinase
MHRNLGNLGFDSGQCGLYLKEEQNAKLVWLTHTMREGSQWRRIVAAAEIQAIEALYHKTLEDGYGEFLIIRGDSLGYWRTWGRVLLVMPLTNGVVVFNGAETDIFDGIEVDCIEAIADFLNDFIQRLEYLRDLETKELQLRQAQRLAMVGQLAAGIVHEVNNSLTVIMGHSELLMVGPLEPLAKESAESISKAVRNTHQIVAKMLDLARFQDGDYLG